MENNKREWYELRIARIHEYVRSVMQQFVTWFVALITINWASISATVYATYFSSGGQGSKASKLGLIFVCLAFIAQNIVSIMGARFFRSSLRAKVILAEILERKVGKSFDVRLIRKTNSAFYSLHDGILRLVVIAIGVFIATWGLLFLWVTFT